MSDQPVYLVAHDPAWATRFFAERNRLERLLAPFLAGPIEHVGSTAVPGLAAKPVVDILAPVRSLAEAADVAVPALAQAGWLFWPDDPNRAYRLWFLRPSPAARTHHLYLMQPDSLEFAALLGFRDALRADPVLRDRYAGLKQALAATHREDREAYTNAKADFVRSVLAARGLRSARLPS